MWGLPSSGIEPVSPALAGRFFITEPPGKPCSGGAPCHPAEAIEGTRTLGAGFCTQACGTPRLLFLLAMPALRKARLPTLTLVGHLLFADHALIYSLMGLSTSLESLYCASPRNPPSPPPQPPPAVLPLAAPFSRKPMKVHTGQAHSPS